MAQASGEDWFPTNQKDWERADLYGNQFLIAPDPVLNHIVKHGAEQGLPVEIAVSPAQGKFLNLIVQTIGAKRILEVGSLGGYSAVWMGRALPAGGELISLELDETHARVSTENIVYAGLQDKAKVIVGDAVASLAKLPDEPKFDLCFIDADKKSMATHVKEAKRLVRAGGIIIVDNLVRHGYTSDLTYTDASTEGVRETLNLLKGDEEVQATQIVTAGEKGLDGFIYAIRK